MELLGDTTCPGCGKDHKATFKLDNLSVEKPSELKNIQVSNPNQVQVQEVKPIEPKVTIKTVAPKDQPFFRCKDCDDKHPNPNYKVRPNKKCPNCGSLNGEKACKNCNRETDSEDWQELDDDELDSLGIPKPETPKHNHNHEDD